MTLTPKQEAFAQAYVETGNAAEAYRRAGYSTAQSDKSIHENASKLHTKILPRIEELQKRARERHDINVDTLTQMLKEDRQLARENAQSSAAVNAVMGMAKLHGLLVDNVKAEVDATVTRIELVAPALVSDDNAAN